MSFGHFFIPSMGGKVEGMSGWAKENRSKHEWVIPVPCQPLLHKGWWEWSRGTDLEWLSVFISEGHLTAPSPGPTRTTRVRIGCDASSINVTETLFPHQFLGLWPRNGSSPNHDDDFFWEEYGIEAALPLILP